jgi:hypothetical protein
MLRIASAITLYVDIAGSDANTGTAGSPFATFQRAIQAAVDGDTISANPGTFNDTNVNFQGKSVRIIGSGPSLTIVDCGNKFGRTAPR